MIKSGYQSFNVSSSINSILSFIHRYEDSGANEGVPRAGLCSGVSEPECLCSSREKIDQLKIN